MNSALAPSKWLPHALLALSLVVLAPSKGFAEEVEDPCTKDFYATCAKGIKFGQIVNREAFDQLKSSTLHPYDYRERGWDRIPTNLVYMLREQGETVSGKDDLSEEFVFIRVSKSDAPKQYLIFYGNVVVGYAVSSKIPADVDRKFFLGLANQRFGEKTFVDLNKKYVKGDPDGEFNGEQCRGADLIFPYPVKVRGVYAWNMSGPVVRSLVFRAICDDGNEVELVDSLYLSSNSLSLAKAALKKLAEEEAVNKKKADGKKAAKAASEVKF